jgi:hypothetical protein
MHKGANTKQNSRDFRFGSKTCSKWSLGRRKRKGLTCGIRPSAAEEGGRRTPSGIILGGPWAVYAFGPERCPAAFNPFFFYSFLFLFPVLLFLL